MTQARRAALEAAGIDVASALERMMGSEALLERLLGKFPEDKNLPVLREALESGDPGRAAAAAHTLKGVCGNLSMTAGGRAAPGGSGGCPGADGGHRARGGGRPRGHRGGRG